jgi:hypothetical protein
MIPQGSIINAPVQEIEQPSRTWKLDFNQRRITGMVDQLEAVKQAVFKILQTERFRYLIYTFNYGHELKTLLGQNPLFVQSEFTRMVSEALTQDDRITSIENMQIDIEGDRLTARFTVVTQYGSYEQEVSEIV